MSYFTVILYFYFYKNTSYSTIFSIQQSDQEIFKRVKRSMDNSTM